MKQKHILEKGDFYYKKQMVEQPSTIYFLFLFKQRIWQRKKKKSGKTERHKRAQSLKPLRATTWNDTKL